MSRPAGRSDAMQWNTADPALQYTEPQNER
jgi:hypothetical protein